MTLSPVYAFVSAASGELSVTLNLFFFLLAPPLLGLSAPTCCVPPIQLWPLVSSYAVRHYREQFHGNSIIRHIIEYYPTVVAAARLLRL